MKQKRYKVGKISYINAFPVYYGLDRTCLPPWLEMIPDSPAVLNNMIKQGEIVISPVSSAFYGMNHRDLLLLPDLSISCCGRVISVVLMSNFPLESLDGKRVVLTEESVTSVFFLKMVLSSKNIFCRFETRSVASLNDVRDMPDAVLVIGDAALTQPWEKMFTHRIDLGQVWFDLTGLPFVFAVWVVRRAFAEQEPDVVNKIMTLFYESRKLGYKNIKSVIRAGAEKLKLKEHYLEEYYDHLLCDLDTEKIKSLDVFFSFLYEYGLFNQKARCRFFHPDPPDGSIL